MLMAHSHTPPKFQPGWNRTLRFQAIPGLRQLALTKVYVGPTCECLGSTEDAWGLGRVQDLRFPGFRVYRCGILSRVQGVGFRFRV